MLGAGSALSSFMASLFGVAHMAYDAVSSSKQGCVLKLDRAGEFVSSTMASLVAYRDDGRIHA